MVLIPSYYSNKNSRRRLEHYKITEAAKALEQFVDELSNWYVRRSRERFWAKDTDQNKINAYMTLYTAHTTVIKLAAPMIPFMTEAIYQNLVFKYRKRCSRKCTSLQLSSS